MQQKDNGVVRKEKRERIRTDTASSVRSLHLKSTFSFSYNRGNEKKANFKGRETEREEKYNIWDNIKSTNLSVYFVRCSIINFKF